MLQDNEEIKQVEAFVKENARMLLGVTPEMFTVSARQALRGKQGEPELWATSRFGALEDFIHKTLDQTNQVKLKF